MTLTSVSCSFVLVRVVGAEEVPQHLLVATSQPRNLINIHTIIIIIMLNIVTTTIAFANLPDDKLHQPLVHNSSSNLLSLRSGVKSSSHGRWSANF